MTSNEWLKLHFQRDMSMSIKRTHRHPAARSLLPPQQFWPESPPPSAGRGRRVFKFVMLALLAVLLLAALMLLAGIGALTGNWIKLAIPLITLVATVIAVVFALGEQL
ncbi:hypothetical protein [Rhizobium sp. P44RR-XXIV]|uniref:hypothetical protein n=1 Tax=Rhizobium sp. P44RR-XXIV TaxID=1921145 RepID=UPI0010A9AED2|nr:hypothetical protein [Rhizobium sp. P44RR-XXIV]TIX90208.1 hypothetical protein BSK43_012925 [Rhizobium sp. P44RR-XXIV]